MQDGWRKGWALSKYSNRIKFRLYVRCATLWQICLLQEKHSVHSSTLVNVNSLNNIRIHLQTTYIYLSLLTGFLMPVSCTGPHCSSHRNIACQMSCWTVCPETSQVLFKKIYFFIYWGNFPILFCFSSCSSSFPACSFPLFSRFHLVGRL